MKPTGSSFLQRRLAADPALFTVVASLAAFGAYTAMYAFRKPFSAATFSGQEIGGVSLKVLFVVAQLVGYTLSKFLGIKIVSEAGAGRRIALIAGLIGLAFVPLVLLPQVPPWAQVVCLFVNGLPLGMIWGLIFGFLEGRRVTEFLGLGMSVSFIFASGWTKSVGVYLISRWAVPELWMPAMAGLVFVPLLVMCLALLAALPAPNVQDIAERSVRAPMDGPQRRQFLARNAVSLALLILPYVLLTVYRDLRDTFMADVLKELGVRPDPPFLLELNPWLGSEFWPRWPVCGGFAIIGRPWALITCSSVWERFWWVGPRWRFNAGGWARPLGWCSPDWAVIWDMFPSTACSSIGFWPRHDRREPLRSSSRWPIRWAIWPRPRSTSSGRFPRLRRRGLS